LLPRSYVQSLSNIFSPVYFSTAPRREKQKPEDLPIIWLIILHSWHKERRWSSECIICIVLIIIVFGLNSLDGRKKKALEAMVKRLETERLDKAL